MSPANDLDTTESGPVASYPSSERSRVRRHPERGTAERAQVRSILEEGLVCQVSLAEGGRPVCIPMGYGLWGEEVILHGSPASRLMRQLAAGVEVCITVTLLDGLVLARSAFHSAMNYRSVVVFGRGRELTDREEKRSAMDAVVDHLVPGWGRASRPTTDGELDGTLVVAVGIEEASAKVRVGPPREPARDVDHPVWAGVIPLRLTPGLAEPAPDLAPGFDPPELVRPARPPSASPEATVAS